MIRDSMDERHLRTAELARQHVPNGTHDRAAFRNALLAVPSDDRDTWLDQVLGLGAPPIDGPELPRGCVPYLPCSVDALVDIVERADVGPTDVFVDVGSGVGRAIALVHLLTGAEVVGIEVQAKLVEVAREVGRNVSSRMSTVHGDAVELAGTIANPDAAGTIANTDAAGSIANADAAGSIANADAAGAIANGTVFFLYCPFSGERLQRVLAALELIARGRPIRVCCVDLPLPPCTWLVPAEGSGLGNVTVFRSVH
jgi:SAM-dependent methyltransferase